MAVTCDAIAKSGKRCGRPVLSGRAHCLMHDPASADSRREAGRKGGHARSNQARARKRLPGGIVTLDELLGVLGLTIADVRAGRVEPGVGATVASLARAYVAVAAQAHTVITMQEAARMVDAFVDAVLATDPSDELRARIAAEYERQLAARSA